MAIHEMCHLFIHQQLINFMNFMNTFHECCLSWTVPFLVLFSYKLQISNRISHEVVQTCDTFMSVPCSCKTVLHVIMSVKRLIATSLQIIYGAIYILYIIIIIIIIILYNNHYIWCLEVFPSYYRILFSICHTTFRI